MTSLEFWAFVAVVAGIYAIFGLGLQLQFGLCGIANFGHVAFMGLAAYVMAILTVRYGVSLALAGLYGVLFAVGFAAAISLISLRLRSDYFAICTIAASEIIRVMAINLSGITGGPEGTINMLGSGQAAQFYSGWIEASSAMRAVIFDLTGIALSANALMSLLTWALAIGLAFALSRMAKSPWGRVLKAIREDEDVARAVGKNVFWYKTQTVMIGAAIAGLSGLIYAFHFTYFSPEDFEPSLTFFAFVIVIIGGIGSIWGVLLGAITFAVIFAGSRFFTFPPFSYLDSSQRAELRLIIVGALIIILMAVRPQGLLGRRRELLLDR